MNDEKSQITSLFKFCVYKYTYHSSTQLTPYEVVYGTPPPSLRSYVGDSSSITTINELSNAQASMLKILKEHLTMAQNRMKKFADKHRSDCEFCEGDWVFLRIQPYNQVFVTFRKTLKLASRFV